MLEGTPLMLPTAQAASPVGNWVKSACLQAALELALGALDVAEGVRDIFATRISEGGVSILLGFKEAQYVRTLRTSCVEGMYERMNGMIYRTRW